jgi:hypothetical protein
MKSDGVEHRVGDDVTVFRVDHEQTVRAFERNDQPLAATTAELPGVVDLDVHRVSEVVAFEIGRIDTQGVVGKAVIDAQERAEGGDFGRRGVKSR